MYRYDCNVKKKTKFSKYTSGCKGVQLPSKNDYRKIRTPTICV